MYISWNRCLLLMVSLAMWAPRVLYAAELTSERRLEIAANHYVASARVPISMSSEEIAYLGAGYAVILQKDALNSILDAARMIGGEGFSRRRIADLPAGAVLALQVTPEMMLLIKSKAFGSRGEAELRLDAKSLRDLAGPFYVGSLPGDFRAHSSIIIPRCMWLEAATRETYERTVRAAPLPRVSPHNPPSVKDLLSKAPSDPEERVKWLRSRTLDLLSSIGKPWLARSGGIPFEYSDFASAGDFKIEALDPERREWLQKFYEQHRKERDESLPLWNSLQDASVALQVKYLIAILVVQQIADRQESRDLLSGSCETAELGTDESGKGVSAFGPGELPPVFKRVSDKGMGWVVK